MAAKAAERLFSYYPQTAASDPVIFMTGLVELFCAYPAVVVESLLSPISGIPAKFKFMPSIAEIKEVLDARTPDRTYARHVEAQRVPQIAGPPVERESLDQLKARHGPNWGLQAHEEDLVARRRHLSEINRANRIGLKKVREIYGGEYNEWASPMLVEKMRNLKHQ